MNGSRLLRISGKGLLLVGGLGFLGCVGWHIDWQVVKGAPTAFGNLEVLGPVFWGLGALGLAGMGGLASLVSMVIERRGRES
ncbi:MAG: hypothetical protein ACI97B_001993 [Verrucomicrobiales bacterium]|jgi:hypothetical protein